MTFLASCRGQVNIEVVLNQQRISGGKLLKKKKKEKADATTTARNNPKQSKGNGSLRRISYGIQVTGQLMTNYVEAGKNSRRSHQHPVTGAAVRSQPFHEGTRAHVRAHARMHAHGLRCFWDLLAHYVSRCLPCRQQHNKHEDRPKKKKKSTRWRSQGAGLCDAPADQQARVQNLNTQ